MQRNKFETMAETAPCSSAVRGQKSDIKPLTEVAAKLRHVGRSVKVTSTVEERDDTPKCAELFPLKTEDHDFLLSLTKL
jgi:hypothetical protein